MSFLILQPAEFNANSSKFIKLINEKGRHNLMVLKPGLNVDPVPFQNINECSPGGIYFTKEDYLWKWYNNNHMYVCDVGIPENANVHTESNYKIKADQVILSNFIQINDYVNQLTSEAQLAAVQQVGDILKYIKPPSAELQLAAVRQDGNAVQYIKSPSEELQLAAVKQEGVAIRHIKSPSVKVQLVAVWQDDCALRYIKSPSVKIVAFCLVRIKNSLVSIINSMSRLEDTFLFKCFTPFLIFSPFLICKFRRNIH